MSAILNTELDELKLLGRGKVRDIYEVEDNLLIVSTDRISAFDVILPNGIEDKGKVLTQISKFWFDFSENIIKNHLITTGIDKMPTICHRYKDILDGRSMLVRKAKPLPVECVVRGYITGSGLKDYNKSGTICGIKLPAGLVESQKFAEPIFTPTTKEDVGNHDEPITFEKMVEKIGVVNATKLRDTTMALYKKASDYALTKGIIIADTKLEFGIYNDEVILIDEVLTPDSSRFWYADKYTVGQQQDSMDKQVVRNYLETLTWNKQPPAPELPENIIQEARKRYIEIAKILTS